MKVHRELRVICERPALGLLACRIEAEAGARYRHSREHEDKMQRYLPQDAVLVFVQKHDDQRHAIVLTHLRNVLAVVNIAPERSETLDF